MTKLTALIVDDSEFDRYLLSRDLQKAEFDITLFEEQNGEDALEFLNAHKDQSEGAPEGFPPQVVFLDVNMPRMGGHEFLQEYERLNLHAVYPNTRIIMFTSSERPEDIDRAKAYPFVSDYLIKGEYSNEGLKSKLKAAIQD